MKAKIGSKALYVCYSREGFADTISQALTGTMWIISEEDSEELDFLTEEVMLSELIKELACV